MKKLKEDKTYEEISDFIASLETSFNNHDGENEGLFFNEVFFTLGDLGGLMLSGKESERYAYCKYLLLHTVDEELVNKKKVESSFQQAILKVLNINGQHPEKLFSERLRLEIKELRRKLNSNPKKYEVFFPIRGLSDSSLPQKVGKIEFRNFDDEQLSKFSNIILSFSGDQPEQSQRIKMAESLREDKIFGNTVAVAEKKALDPYAARFSAEKEISLTIDIINFFTSLTPNQNGNIFLPGEFEFDKFSIPIISIENHPEFLYKYEVTGLNKNFSFEKLFELDNENKFNFRKVSSILAFEENKNEVENRLISSMRWAGKASTELKKEVAFLLYAISLESLILLDNEKDELIDRLSNRVALLIGNNLSNRKEIRSAMKELYDIRSKIVHSGSYQVTDIDLNTIRVYTQSCIYRILTKEPFISMKGKNDFSNWFLEEIFKDKEINIS